VFTLVSFLQSEALNFVNWVYQRTGAEACRFLSQFIRDSAGCGCVVLCWLGWDEDTGPFLTRNKRRYACSFSIDLCMACQRCCWQGGIVGCVVMCWLGWDGDIGRFLTRKGNICVSVFNCFLHVSVQFCVVFWCRMYVFIVQ